MDNNVQTNDPIDTHFFKSVKNSWIDITLFEKLILCSKLNSMFNKYLPHSRKYFNNYKLVSDYNLKNLSHFFKTFKRILQLGNHLNLKIFSFRKILKENLNKENFPH